MTKARYIFFLLSLVAGVTMQANCQQILQCSLPSRPGTIGEDFVQPVSAEERSRLGQAPRSAKRLGRHTIVVTWAGGQQTLKDKQPHNFPYGGVHWTYCGYNSDLKLHMLLKQDESLLTGALVDDTTGSLLPGGEKILFSKNAQHYLAYEQPDGLDGEMIKLYLRDGTLLWNGYNGVLTPDGKFAVANFQKMHWDDQDRLVAEAHIVSTREVQSITLTQNSTGKWEWLPHISQ